MYLLLVFYLLTFFATKTFVDMAAITPIKLLTPSDDATYPSCLQFPKLYLDFVYFCYLLSYLKFCSQSSRKIAKIATF